MKSSYGSVQNLPNLYIMISMHFRIMGLEAVIHQNVQNFNGTIPSTSCQPAIEKKRFTQPLSCQSPDLNRLTTSAKGKRPSDRDSAADRLGTRIEYNRETKRLSDRDSAADRLGTRMEYNRETKRLSDRDTVPDRPRKRARSPDHNRQTATAKRHCNRDLAPDRSRKKTVTARHRDRLYSMSCHTSDKQLPPSRRKPWIY